MVFGHQKINHNVFDTTGSVWKTNYEKNEEKKNQSAQRLSLWVTCLAIGKDTGIVSQESVIQQTLSETLEHNILT